MKLTLLLVVCCGAALSAGNTYGDAIALVRLEMSAFWTKLAPIIEQMSAVSNCDEASADTVAIINFTANCVLVVTAELTTNITKEQTLTPMADYSEIEFTMNLLPDVSQQLVDLLRKLCSQNDEITSTQIEEVRGKSNHVHSIFSAVLLKILKCEGNVPKVDMQQKLRKWEKRKGTLTTALDVLRQVSRNGNKNALTKFATEMIRLVEQLDSIKPNILQMVKLVGFEAARDLNRSYFLQLAPIYIVDMYYNILAIQIYNIAANLLKDGAIIPDSYEDNIEIACEKIPEIMMQLTSTTQACEYLNKYGVYEGACTANLSISIGKFSSLRTAIASLYNA